MIQRKQQLEELYSRIHTESCGSIIKDGVRPDHFLRHPGTDRRFGLTLLIEIEHLIAESMCAIGEEIKIIEPEQYDYPSTDLHITVLDLIGAHENFICNETQMNVFHSIIEEVVNKVAPFEIEFKGIILSPTGVLVKGFYREGLPVLRDMIRHEARNRRLDLQERYQSISAHVSLMRFSTFLGNRTRLLQFMEKNRERSIGGMTVRGCTMVIHDWYNRRRAVVGRFMLAGEPERKKTG